MSGLVRVPLPFPFETLSVSTMLPGLMRKRDGRVHWAVTTPDGPGALALEPIPEGVGARAWGAGADWLVERVPALVGCRDDPTGFEPHHEVIADLWRRRPLRLGRTELLYETLLVAVAGQKVQTVLARRSLALLAARFGEPAPGPLGLRLLPTAQRLAELRYFHLHPCGLERKRAEAMLRIARRAERLEEAVSLGVEAARARLASLPGVGPWTVAMATSVAFGDPDAVPVGDLHVPHSVTWALAGEPRGSDERMLELLEPYRGQRGRVVALLKRSGARSPRYGPKLEVLPVDRYDRPDAPMRDRGPGGGGYRTLPPGPRGSGQRRSSRR